MEVNYATKSYRQNLGTDIICFTTFEVCNSILPSVIFKFTKNLVPKLNTFVS